MGLTPTPLKESGQEDIYAVPLAAARCVSWIRRGAWGSSSKKFRHLGNVRFLGELAEVGRRVIVATDLGPEDLARFGDGDNLWWSVRLNYCDAFGYAHMVERCILYDAEGNNEYCGTYGDAHTGQGDPDPECQPATTP